MSFQTHLRGDPTLNASWQRFLSLTRQLRSYRAVDPPTNHHKVIPANLVFHIYKKQYSHLSTAIRQLTEGAFFFGIWSCKYYTTPKGKHKWTCILRKGDIKFYRKQRELPHSIECLNLADKVSPKFRTHKTGVKNSKVTQWQTGKISAQCKYGWSSSQGWTYTQANQTAHLWTQCRWKTTRQL